MGRGRRLPSLTKAQLVKCLERDGWYWCSVAGRNQQQDHLAMCHQTKKGKVSIPHSAQEYHRRSKLLRSILQQANLSMKDLTEIYFQL